MFTYLPYIIAFVTSNNIKMSAMEHQRDWQGTSAGALVWVSDQDEAYVPGVMKNINGMALPCLSDEACLGA